MARGSKRAAGLPPEIAVNPAGLMPAPPPTLPPWAKVLWWLAETAAVGLSFNHFQFGKEILGIGAGESTTDAQTWRRFAFKWSNLNSDEAADDSAFTIDIANVTNGDIDSTWTDADYTTVVNLLNQIVGTMATFAASYNQLTEIRAYIMAFNPYSNPKPFAQSGEPERVFTTALTGALAQPAGAVVCTTVSERTASRAHWGRFYSPSLGANALIGGGRLASQYVDALAVSVHDSYQSLMDAQFFPVVPTTQVNKTATRTLQTVSGIAVDDVPDTQRSRRPKHARYRRIMPLAATTRPVEELDV